MGWIKAQSVRLPSSASFRSGSATSRKDPTCVYCFSHLPDAIGGAVDFFLDEARAIRMFVAMDQAHKLGLGRIGAVGIDMKLDRRRRASPRSCPCNQRP